MWVIKGSFIFLCMSLLGGEMIVDSPKEITPKWELEVLGICQEELNLEESLHEMIGDMIQDSFGTDFIGRVQAVVKKNPTQEGVYTETWKNGAKKLVVPYKDGKAHGHVHGWYENGEDAFKGYFSAGVKQGVHITCYPTREGGYWDYARVCVYTEKGVLEGEAFQMHPNRHLALCVNYIDGIANGEIQAWDKKGKQYLDADYKKGVLEKKYEQFPVKRMRKMHNPYSKYVNEVRNTFIEEVCKEYDLSVQGIGGGMPYDIEVLIIKFSAKKKGAIKNARELLVNLKDKLVKVVNAHEKIRPYLREYPFTAKRAKISIIFVNKNGHQYEDGSVSHVFVGKGEEVLYLAKKSLYKSFDLHKEPYEVANSIVKEKKKNKD